MEHAFTSLELPGLTGVVIGVALLGLGRLPIFSDDRDDFVNPSLHVLDVLNDRPVRQRLLFLGLSGKIDYRSLKEVNLMDA